MDDPTLPASPPPADCGRYVLPEDAPYLRNLAALWAADPPLARRVEALHPAGGYPVEPSKAGPPTVRKDLGDGRRVYLHSRYKPVEEAKALVAEVRFDETLFFYVHGFGLGYALEQLFDDGGDDAVFCVFEPDVRMLRTAFEHRDLSRLIESRRVMFFTDADRADLLTRLTPHAALVSTGTATVVHPPSVQVAPDFYRQVQTWTEEFASFTRTSLNTLVLNGRRTAENIARNLGRYVSAPCLSRLKDRHHGEPAIIVSAGPSLRKNKHLLTDAAGKAVLIAVQTTLRPLLEMGVEPTYVTSLDYHEICTRFFENLPASLSAELVAEPKANPAVFSMYPGAVSLLGNDFAENLLREMRLGRSALPGGATVAHLAFYLAEHLGCDPIIFVGQDLGFGDGLCYAPGTSYEDVWRPELGRFCSVEMKQWEQIVRDRHILRRISDYQGRAMYTEERLFSYLQQFERDFAQSKARIIDATEGGAAKRGATYMTLANALADYCTRPVGAMGHSAHPGPDDTRLPEAAECVRRRRDEAEQIEQVARETLPLLEEVRDHLHDQPRVNRAIARLDALRVRMNELGPTYDLITQLAQQSEMKRFTADRKLSAAKADAGERQRRQVARDVENVKGVIEAAEAFRRLMDDVGERLGSASGERDSTGVAREAA